MPERPLLSRRRALKLLATAATLGHSFLPRAQARDAAGTRTAVTGTAESMASSAGQLAAAGRSGRLTAGDLQQFLKSLDGGWVDWERTVDTFKSGSPDTEVAGIAVAWISTLEALKRALALNCNVFITHEPTYYNHFDAKDDVYRGFPTPPFKLEQSFALEAIRAKEAFIETSGIVILRSHDLWDQYPGEGIADAWAALLGFDEPIAGSGFYRIYDVAGRTALDVARQVARRTKPLKQDAVELVGDPDTSVSRVAIGTGAITPFVHMMSAYDVDLVICSDDGFWHWRDGALAIDTGTPVIIANHGVSEIPGMKRLAAVLSDAFPRLPVHFIPQIATYRLVTV